MKTFIELKKYFRKSLDPFKKIKLFHFCLKRSEKVNDFFL